MSDARKIIERLDLDYHPEGGWYRETWRAPADRGQRSAGTAVLFLLEAGQRSHWHTVNGDEIWMFHAGDPLRLFFAESEHAPVQSIMLGNDVLAGQVPQHLVAAGTWQSAEREPLAPAGYSLVSCTVVPGFEFDGFTLAPPGWSPSSER